MDIKTADKQVELKRVETNGIALNVAFAGPEDGKPVLFLHGFPDAWFSWRRQIEALAQKNFRLIVPDQRGYNLSDKPARVEDYRSDLLVGDLIGLMDSLGYERFSLAGHDWGGIISWLLALEYPHRLEKLAILNAPHPAVFRRLVRSSPEQMLKSWYILFFQLPQVPEFLNKAMDWQVVLSQLPEMTWQEQQEYRKAWEQDSAFSSMLNWYRAAMSFPPHPAAETLSVPTLIIWGDKDKYISSSLAEASWKKCSSGKLLRFPDAGHWVYIDECEKVNQALIEHFA